MQNLMNVNFRNISGVDAVLGDASVAISANQIFLVQSLIE